MQRKTARLTVLLDPSRKQAFEHACHGNDMTPSQVIRHLIREYIATQLAATATASAVRPIRVKPSSATVPAPATPPPKSPRRAASKR